MSCGVDVESGLWHYWLAHPLSVNREKQKKKKKPWLPIFFVVACGSHCNPPSHRQREGVSCQCVRTGFNDVEMSLKCRREVVVVKTDWAYQKRAVSMCLVCFGERFNRFAMNVWWLCLLFKGHQIITRSQRKTQWREVILLTASNAAENGAVHYVFRGGRTLEKCRR